MTSSKSSVLKDVVAYVDVWSSDKRANYSKPFIQQLEEMGARVSKGFNKQVTHVVFSYGHQATWKKAKKRDVQLVSVLWVGRCYDDGVRADESLFPALNDEKNPVMKNRQHRCMLPKHSPERTIENDWRLKKKFEKLVKELPLSEPQVVDTSPIIIDQENGIIYSPALKRSDYMAQRLKDMKEKRENISPTGNQKLKTRNNRNIHSLFSFVQYAADDVSDEAFVAEPGGSPAKEEERSSDDEDHNLSGRDSTKPWLSPCQASETIRSGDFSQSPVQDTPSKSQILHKERRQSHGKPTRVLPKESENKLKIPVKKPSTDTKSQVSPNAVKSLNRRSSSATVVRAATETPNKSAPAKKTECRTPKKARLSFSALVRSFTVPSECKNVASSSTDGGTDVFEDYFSPSNHKRPVLPSLHVESKIEVPFELDPLPKRRKRHCDKYLKHESRRSSGRVQGDLEFPLLGPNSPTVDVKQVSQRQNSVEFSSSSKTTEDAEKLRPASTSGNPPLDKEDVTESEQQKNSDLTANCHSSEILNNSTKCFLGGGNECTVAAGFTEITSVAEENQNKQADGSLQKMVNKTKSISFLWIINRFSDKVNGFANSDIENISCVYLIHVYGLPLKGLKEDKPVAPRTLVMTSMPSEKQQTVLQVVKALGGFSIIDRVCESTTHVVSGEHRRTLNILLGIARGCWILSFEWILWCLEQRQWIPEEPYELSDQFPAAQICRLQRHLSAGEHQQNLFQDQPPIFVSQRSQPPTQSLVELIELCGGTACKTVRQAGICIGKYSGRRPEGSRILSEQWILDSITNLKILPYDNYDLE
uniref:Microcephalin 1 n=1 Tax=Poecilia formosa TaxID=48698 RepID=A0A096M5B6_POEFO